MIVTLTVECVFGAHFFEECVRILEIDERASLSDLHEAIQDAVGFDRDHLFGYYIAHNRRGRRQWLSESEGWEDQLDDYDTIRLKDVFPIAGGRKLHYLFDYGDDWTFEVRRTRQKPKEPQPGVKYPRVVERVGPNPEQYPDPEM